MNRLIIGACGVLIVVVYITGLRLDIAKKEIKEQRDLAEQHWVRAENLEQSLKRERRAVDELSRHEKETMENLENAKAEINNLRDIVTAGRAELRIKASCPSATMPETASANSSNDASTPKLDRDAEQNYWRLREEHERVIQQIKSLQNYARICSEFYLSDDAK